MFCGKCGTEVQEGAQFCPNCGAQQTLAPQVQPQSSINFGSPSVPKVNQNSVDVKSLASAALFILMTILWFCKCFSVGASLFGSKLSQGFTINDTFKDLEFLSYITVILFVVSAVICLLPILKSGVNMHKMLIFPFIISIWAVAVFFIVLIGASENMNSSVMGVKISDVAKFSPTFGSWLYIIVSVVQAVLLFLQRKALKK